MEYFESDPSSKLMGSSSRRDTVTNDNFMISL